MIEEFTTTEATEVAETEFVRPAPASLGEQALLFLVTAAVIVVDHLSKLFIEAWLPLNQSWRPFPTLADYFQITHVSNTGAAFGLFPSQGPVFMIVAFIVSLVIILYNYRLPAGHRLFRLALGLQLGGALGNLIDRLRLGHVTDFLDFGPWPVFNLADTSIVAGVAVLGYLMVLEHRQEAQRRRAEEAAPPQPAERPVEQTEDQHMLWNE
ncbi:MAG: signal peptidase II [Chloroflexi bacterium]|nr:signal peptidase II [Chloroflexota bacterium]MCI0574804.1 signal peptidase II [Chloroflexota bacterium]MCI0649825.1 signal peptidase II [Chloroflexota bacterium]MCI0729122.1 signal peptidase II [Chloroflexota bacterium]